ncbi:Ig-like domain repeat protein [Granulicella cerasi]|uniref:Ig-like domain repeat protein n=1 Tax=Granulicella cerasi TaxID=741063 RepID=A0ABW1Z4V6_9BACT|nr:Ig-like domain repeat protein [Granulicella cerasi]
MKLFGIALALVTGLGIQTASAQTNGTPVPFISTAAGNGSTSTISSSCTTGIPVFSTSGTGSNYGDGCLSTQAVLSAPISTLVDKYGNLIIADQTHNSIRVVYNGGTDMAAAIVAANVQTTGLTPTKGNIYTLVGSRSAVAASPYYCNGASGAVGLNSTLDGCPGIQAYIQPRGLGLDADGNIFFGSVAGASAVRVVYIAGTAVKTLITNGNAKATSPQAGYVYAIAGTTSSSYAGDGSIGSAASVNTPRGFVIDGSENVYFADNLNNVVRRIDGTTGVLSTIAGHCIQVKNPTSGAITCTATATSGDGAAATDASVNIYQPYAVAIDSNGNLFIAEGGSTTVPGRVRVVYAGGTLPGITSPVVGNIYTYAGGASTASTATAAQKATFQFIYGVAIDQAGYVYATEYRSGSSGGNHIYRIDPTTGGLLILAGSGTTSTVAYTCAGLTSTNAIGDGCPAPLGNLNTPQGPVAFDAQGNAYVADRMNNVIRKLTWNNVFPSTAVGSSTTQNQAFYLSAGTTLLAKSITSGGSASTEFTTNPTPDNCTVNTSIAAAIVCVNSVTFKPSTAGSRAAVYTLTDATGTVATEPLVGVGVAPLLTIMPGTRATIGTNIKPSGVSTDKLGNVYVSDATGGRVLRSTVAGGAGTAVLTGLTAPRQSAVDSAGNLFVADSSKNAVVELTASGAQVTLGTGLNAPQGVAVDRYNNLYIADTANNRLLYLNMVNGAQSTVSTGLVALSSPSSLYIDAAGDVYIVNAGTAKLVELPITGPATAVALPTSVAPVAVASDLSGTLFIADSGTQSVLSLSAGASATTTLISGFTTLTGIAVGPSGNLFVSDSGATSAVAYNTNASSYTFPTTNLGQSSLPTAVTVSNFGNAAATLATPPYSQSGTSAAFPISGTAGCAAAQSLGGGASCVDSFTFTPTVTGTQSSTTTFAATTGQSAAITFTGLATNLISTTSTIAITPANTTLTYGNNGATFTATLAASQTGASTPTGTVTFLIDGVAQTPTQSVSGAGPYTFTFNSGALKVGTHTIGVSYSGDTLYGATSAQTTVTVTGLAATLSATAAYGPTNNSYTFTATVTPTTSTQAPTGTVTFTVDGVASTAVNLTGGTAVFTKTLTDGSHAYSAAYSGDAAYTAQTTATQIFVFNHIATSTVVTGAQTGAGLTVTATITAASQATAAPSGTVIFTVDGKAQAAVAITNGQASVNVFPAADGSHTFSAVYSGDAYYATSASAQGTLSTLRVASVTTLALIPSITGTGVNGGSTTSNLSLVATVAAASGSGPVPTGSVIFYTSSGTKVVPSGTSAAILNAAGVATLTVAQSTLTSTSFYAVYAGASTTTPNGDGNYLTSTSSPVTIATDFYINDPVINLSVAQGAQAYANLVLSSYGGYTGTLTAQCAGLPANAVCRYTPINSVTLSSTTQSAVLPVQFFVGIDPNLASTAPKSHSSTVLAWLFGTPLALLGLLRRKRLASRLGAATIAILMALTVTSMTGCGNSQSPVYNTPLGTTAVTVTVKDSATGATKTATVNLTVLAKQ